MATNVDLWMMFDGAYRLTLSIPVVTCYQFSKAPLAWLRYLAYTIYGTEGYISSSPGGSEVDHYPATDLSSGSYYYVSQGPCLLLDPKLMDDRTSNTSEATSRVANFRKRVIQRDQRCVLVANSAFEACHIIPHAKGHKARSKHPSYHSEFLSQTKYIRNLMTHRGEALERPLEDINDTRNGLLLSLPIRGSFGATEVAFLRTPNFAMTIDDVGHTEQPSKTAVHSPLAGQRLTIQHFDLKDDIVGMVAPHNSDARQSHSVDWPPPIIFDVAYGCVALNKWGVNDFKQYAEDNTKDTYYGCNDDTGDGGDGDNDDQPRQSQKIRRQTRKARAGKRKKARTVGRLARKIDDNQRVDAYDMILTLWMQNAKRNPHQTHILKADSLGSREKVREWLKSVE